jgi:acetyltransferase-like isoleucine patch superfamily enzyme
LRIGAGTKIGSFTKIKASEGPLEIGAEVSISVGCDISSGASGVFIGDDCLISSHVHIIGNNYNYDRIDIPIRLQGTSSKGIRIGSNVWVGAGACILDGSLIGDGVIVTPLSVVSSRIPENTIIQGNPAKIIFKRR